jgi:hypothetical protein
MKLTTLNKFLIPICIIICSIFILYLVYNLLYKLNNSTNRFEDISPDNNQQSSITTQPVVTAMSIPTEELIQTCSANNNIVGFCMNYAGCCGKQSSESNKCFCEHPFVKDCNKTYDECKQTSQNSADCKDKLKECCTSYNNINIDNSNFEQPINRDQISQKLCSFGSINGLSTDSMKLKCMELCQTNNECKAYSTTSNMTCVLYDNILPIPTKIGAKVSKESTKYYIKK